MLESLRKRMCLNTEGEGRRVTQNGMRGGWWCSEIGQGEVPLDKWTYLKHGVGKRSGRFEPYMLEASINYVMWLCKHSNVYGLRKINKKLAHSLT